MSNRWAKIVQPIRRVADQSTTVSQTARSNTTNLRVVSSEEPEFKVFDGLSDVEVRTILAATTRLTVCSGQEICRQGDDGDSMYFTVSGRTQVTVAKPDVVKPGSAEPAESSVINTLGPGSHFGAMSMLIGSPRSATVTATMDTEVLQLVRTDFDRLVQTVPGFAANLSRTLGGWLHGQLAGHQESKEIRVVGFVHNSAAGSMLGPAVIQAIARSATKILTFTPQLSRWNNLRQRTNVETVELHRSSSDGLAIPDLDEKVEQYTHTVIDLDAQLATPRQLLQCERIWWVFDRDGSPESEREQLAKIKGWIEDVPELAKRLQIVEIHEKANRLPGLLETELELTHNPIRVQRLPSIAGEFSFQPFNGFRIQDIARLQHLLQGFNLGLVLGGGGARGLAHIGAIEAFEARGLFFDQIAGTSAGSIIGCGYAAGMTTREILNLINQEMTPPKWIQKLPRGTRMYLFFDFRRGRVETKLRKHFYDYDLAQLLIPIHTVSVDLIGGDQVVSSTGNVAASIRASANHPVFGAPIMRDGYALVDGAVLNNVPATVLRDRDSDFIVSIDVGSKLDDNFVKTKTSRSGKTRHKIGYVNTLMRVLDTIQRGHAKTHLAQSDFVIAPDTSKFPFEDFTRAKELADVGREAATNALPEFIDTLEPYLTIP